MNVFESIASFQAMLDRAAAKVAAEELEEFDAVVAGARAYGETLPSDVSSIRKRLADGNLGPVEALWLLIDKDKRPDLETFRRRHLNECFGMDLGPLPLEL